MSLLVTGTIGIDTIETPFDRADDVLGGSAVYFAFAANLLGPVRLVGAVGDDFPSQYRDMFNGTKIDTTGMEMRAGSKTFRWHGKYMKDWNERETLRTDLNIVAEAPPKIPDSYRDSRYVFLANTHPAVQLDFRRQLKAPKLVVCDTMNIWIVEHRDALLAMLREVDGIVLNDSEAWLLTEEIDVLRAGREVLKLGPKFVIIKKGAHGAIFITSNDIVAMPAYPTLNVMDPTGAGDSFAGGMMSYLASVDRTDLAAMKVAMACGACTASIAIEDFSLRALTNGNRTSFEQRLAQYKTMLTFS